MRTGILGGGLCGLSLAYFLGPGEKTILEAEGSIGGLLQSHTKEGITYDIGPHILFSKDKETLGLILELLGENAIKHRRSNRVFYKGRFVKYPFENDLYSLPEEDRERCLEAYLNNPHENADAKDMLSFFLKAFGEGITRAYLEPYNRKIWKFDPALMDTQMVERIPKPPKEDVIRSARGESTEGYLHQLYFYYPHSGGISSLAKAVEKKISGGTSIRAGCRALKVRKAGKEWIVETTEGTYSFDRLVSTIPLPELVRLLGGVPESVRKAADGLKHNSITIVIVNVDRDNLGDNFAVMVPDPGIMFHRVSKLDFLGENYSRAGTATLMAEITYREGDACSRSTDREIVDSVLEGLLELGFIEDKKANFWDVQRVKYAYVIYDLGHRKNVDTVKGYLASIGISVCGRFGEYEYLNMDQVIGHARELAGRMDDEG